MGTQDIFSQIASHMREGINVHECLAQAYDFVGLYGSAKCQYYHQLEELKGFQFLLNYYATHYHELLQIENIIHKEIIPDAWYKYTTMAVDGNTRKNSLKMLMTKWIEWEISTKKLYQEMRQQLYANGEVAAALFIDKYIEDVSEELSGAQKRLIELESIGYEATEVLELEISMEKKYKKKLGW